MIALLFSMWPVTGAFTKFFQFADRAFPCLLYQVIRSTSLAIHLFVCLLIGGNLIVFVANTIHTRAHTHTH